ncbi:Dihydroorotate dehydrogenase B (NAD(+)), catalytic subunit [Rubripirellula lacrimiformis]|uniref:dihydrouracil dehydrogenase (NAD(+)) n=1 Tax=Rubripirellula lacrimiformis TaxID=1930273 RepID=A0A517N502_9BACT|nr:dihydroorotate dehydrogenase-like protein [Rubripirellula lacrimiformis]QDT02098.1 Dihydroorotate dehydrogenase B (NAD(+)), catalytic subunit [Rubripirellula lacrimiformis]
MPFQLNTNFGGLRLASPVIVGACPMSMNEHTRLAMQNAGAGAIVLPSLFEEQVIPWSLKIGRPVTDHEKTIMANSQRTKHNWACPDADSYLALVNRASTLQDIPIIASLNGFTAGGWMDFAGELQAAGAAAIELNVHHGRAEDYESSGEIEATIRDAVRDINAAIQIPLFVKVSRNFTSIPHVARQLLSGASGLVLHGRAPTVDLCLDTLKLASRWRLTRSDEEPESLDMLMQVHSYCPAMPLAASGGIGHADHLIKTLLSGADVAMVTSAIYREGPNVIRNLLDGLTRFMESHHMQSMLDLRTQRPLQFNSDEERAAYITALTAHIDTAESMVTPPNQQSDRWGHPTA